MAKNNLAASFRDPSGFLFKIDNTVYRQINSSYREHFDFLLKSGLYKKLTSEGLLIPHQEANLSLKQTSRAYKIIKPTQIPFISYPYEWCFSQLKDSALVTLKIQKIALEHGMTLKDASAFNIQFFEGKPVLIDTLSFEKYKEGEPWVAYKQFCQHFLATLALMAYTDFRLSSLFKNYIDGIPLDLTVKLLPFKARLRIPLFLHLFMHAKSQINYADKQVKKEEIKKSISKTSLLALIDSLESGVNLLKWKPAGTEWGDYYPENNNYVSSALKQKTNLVKAFLNSQKTNSVWDLGGNTGLFSRLASDQNIPTVSFDIDPDAIEVSYETLKNKKEKFILPLLLDLTNPSPALGWDNQERDPILYRAKVDTIFALAIIHHLAISNNVSLENLASLFAKLCNNLVVEFIPKEDSQVQKLLATREDIFPDYTKEGFEKAFANFFLIEKCELIKASKRFLYLMRKNGQKE
ncbi:MAG: SAM-dependent methyltransferase [bacterium]|nr:SAM-dependent methyltransferase [bacterium]